MISTNANFRKFDDASGSQDPYFKDDDILVQQTKCQMVIGAFEKCLADAIINKLELVESTSGPASKALESFRKSYKRDPEDNEELIRKSSIEVLINIARHIHKDRPEKADYERLSELVNSLKIYQTRSSSFAHTANKYLPVYWARAQALALDPVLAKLGFISVIERHKQALKGELFRVDLPASEYSLIPNNLPSPDFDRLYGREKAVDEIKEFLLNPRKPSICVYGAGGTGKTACALSALRDLCLSEAGHENFDILLSASLKHEFLENGVIRSEELDATWNAVKDQLVNDLVKIAEEYDISGVSFETDLANLTWDSVISLLAEKRVILWIDNLETLQTDLQDGFNLLEASLPRDWKVLISSRVRVRDTSKIISLSDLDLKSATTLFLTEYQSQMTLGLPFKEAEECAKSLYCNPLAIKNAITCHRKTGRPLHNSISVNREAIIAYSYRNLIPTISSDAMIFCEALFAFTKASRYDLARFLEMPEDSLALAILELEDLGLLALTVLGEESYSLSDNFRGYLAKFPLCLDTRKSANVFLRRQKALHSSLVRKERSNDYVLKFRHIGAHTMVSTSIYSTVTKAIEALGRHYKAKDTGSASELEALRPNLRQAIGELEEIAATLGANACKHPEVYRLLGNLYKQFIDEASAIRFLSMATDLGDASAAHDFYRLLVDTKDTDSALQTGRKLVKILGIPSYIDRKYLSFMYSFLGLLREKGLFDEMITHCSSWNSMGDHASFFLVHLSIAYSKKAKSQWVLAGDNTQASVQCEWFQMAQNYIIEAQKSPNRHSSLINKQSLRLIEDICHFIQRSESVKALLPDCFLQSSLLFYKKNWDICSRYSIQARSHHGQVSASRKDTLIPAVVKLYDDIEKLLGH